MSADRYNQEGGRDPFRPEGKINPEPQADPDGEAAADELDSGSYDPELWREIVARLGTDGPEARDLYITVRSARTREAQPSPDWKCWGIIPNDAQINPPSGSN